MKKYSLIFMLMTLIGCSGGSNSNPSGGDSDLTLYDLPIKTKASPEPMSVSQADVLEKLKAHKQVSFREITRLMIQKHVKAANTDVSVEMLQKFISEISPSSYLTPAKTKVTYEGKIKEMNGGKGLVYNLEKMNIADIYFEKRMQCYSGTYLYELIRRQQGAAQFRSANEVVIFQEGHVLPGYMFKGTDGYRLIGIETTESGGARVELGLAKDLNGIRVVDAELFALIEIFSDEITNPQEVMNAALKTTAQKYGIELKNIYSGSASTEETKKQLNQSIFAFGSPRNTQPGDQERSDSGDDGSQPDKPTFEGAQAVHSPKAEEVGESERQKVLGKNCEKLTGEYSMKPGLGNPRKTVQIYVSSCEDIFVPTMSESFELRLFESQGSEEAWLILYSSRRGGSTILRIKTDSNDRILGIYDGLDYLRKSDGTQKPSLPSPPMQKGDNGPVKAPAEDSYN